MKVIPNTPASEAGLRRGDVIISIDNQPIKTADELQRIVDQSGLGTSLSIQVKRGNQTRQFRVKTAQLDEVMENE
jgi:S1-C subfamily serine protease